MEDAVDLSTVFSRAQCGVDAPLVQVETHISNGLPAFNIVGLPATAVRESKERVRSALLNSHFEWPDRRLTVNLAPADLPKDGGRFDLPIALGILAASGQLPADALDGREFIGELALDGDLRPVPGSVSAAIACCRMRRTLALPEKDAATAALVPGSRIIAFHHLLPLCAWLQGRDTPPYVRPEPANEEIPYPDLADVQGQPLARRALEVAATGGHNLLFSGPPGTGKTMLASRLPGILPPPSRDELLEIMALRSAVPGRTDSGRRFQRPFRAPHHSASPGAMVGGGSVPRPGEISLAHNGVLFLDELPEFPRRVLEVLREPLEAGHITISRALQQLTFPARFQLVAAMNPCPCGFDGDPQRHCRCTPDQVQRYRQRLSGPLLDRIDLLVSLVRIPAHQLLQPTREECSGVVRERVSTARQLALVRQGCVNAQLEGESLQQYCTLDGEASDCLEHGVEQMGLTARNCHRVLRVARSIADLANREPIGRQQVLEALGYRHLEASSGH
jgi:magnesium chelatase family protein